LFSEKKGEENSVRKVKWSPLTTEKKKIVPCPSRKKNDKEKNKGSGGANGSFGGGIPSGDILETALDRTAKAVPNKVASGDCNISFKKERKGKT